MLGWAVTFLVVALFAGVLGFTAVTGAALGLGKILFYVFAILSMAAFVSHVTRHRAR